MLDKKKILLVSTLISLCQLSASHLEACYPTYRIVIEEECPCPCHYNPRPQPTTRNPRTIGHVPTGKPFSGKCDGIVIYPYGKFPDLYDEPYQS